MYLFWEVTNIPAGNSNKYEGSWTNFALIPSCSIFLLNMTEYFLENVNGTVALCRCLSYDVAGEKFILTRDICQKGG